MSSSLLSARQPYTMPISLDDEILNTESPAYNAPFVNRSTAMPAASAYRDFAQNNHHAPPALGSRAAASSSSNSASGRRSLRDQAHTLFNRAHAAAFQLAAKAWNIYFQMSLPKRAMLLATAVCVLAAGVLFLVFHEQIFHLLVEFAQSWKQLPAGPYIMFGLIVLISFPPLIGYSTLSSLCGMMYGFPGGWPLLASATLVGSTLSFLTFRYLLSGFAARLAQSNRKFAALTKTMESDNFMLLAMIRLCPLPYSLSNGGLASIPSVTPRSFILATALTSPKLLIHVFIGDRIARLGTEKDTATKIVDVLSILLAAIFAAATAYTIYVRTIERAEHLDGALYDALELARDDDDDYENFIDDELLSPEDSFAVEGDRAAPRRNL